MKKKLKAKLDYKSKVQEYVCPNFWRRRIGLDVGHLMSMEDWDFHWESWNGVLVPEGEKLAAQDVWDADENATSRNHDLVQVMLSKMEVAL